MLAGASEWTYGKNAELLTGVPNPPELDPTVSAIQKNIPREVPKVGMLRLLRTDQIS